MHIQHFAFPLAELVDNGAGKFIGNVDIGNFHRFHFFAVFICLIQYFGFADRKFIAFAAHIFDQDR